MKYSNIQSSINCLGLPFVFFPIAVSLLLVCVPSVYFVFFLLCVYQGSVFSNDCQHFFVCCMFCPVDFLYYSIRSHFKSLHSFCILLFTVHVSYPYSTIILHILVFIIRFWRFLLVYFSVIFSSLRN